MGALADFYRIRSAEDFFDFFALEYDEEVVRLKRALIMKRFGDRVKRVMEIEQNEDRLLDLFKFALIATYKDFEGENAPGADEVWGLPEGSHGACSSCATVSSCKPKETGGCAIVNPQSGQ